LKKTKNLDNIYKSLNIQMETEIYRIEYQLYK